MAVAERKEMGQVRQNQPAMDKPVVSGVVSSRNPVEEGQLLKIKAAEPPGSFEQDYFQLEVVPEATLVLVLRQSYQNGLISALVPAEPQVYPGTEVRFVPRQPEPGVIQGPVVHAVLAGEAGCALQIANFGQIPPHFAGRRFEIEIHRIQGPVRLPVVKQSFQYGFSGSELLTVILGNDQTPENFPAGSWARFYSV
ncbi:hypothetical protein IV102_15430 [bacterium]|nr:hypothetical protein [bacterium]